MLLEYNEGVSVGDEITAFFVFTSFAGMISCFGSTVSGSVEIIRKIAAQKIPSFIFDGT
jgi:hypothetical protein